MSGIVVYRGGKSAKAGGGIVRYEGIAQAEVGDPYWDNVVSLLLFSEAAGEIAITDERGVTWTRDGAAIMSSGESRFGTTSLFVPNITGYDGFQTAAGLIPGDEAITLEGWIFITDINGYWGGWNPLFGQGGGVGGGDQMFGLYNGSVVWLRGAGLPGGQVALLGTTVAAANQWHHIEFGYDGRNGYVFLNGVLEGVIADTTGWVNDGAYVTLGRELVFGFDQFRMGLRGYIGGTRITAGVCRHTASFTPPSVPFPVG